MTWIDALLNNLRLLWPFWTIHDGQQGVLYKLGRASKILGPGMYFILWLFWDLRVESIVSQPLIFDVQSVTTKDEKSVSFTVKAIYEVNDLQAKQTKVTDFEDTLRAVAEIHLMNRVRVLDLGEFFSKQSWLEDRLVETLTNRAKKYGVTFTDVGFTNVVVTKQFRLFTDIELNASHTNYNLNV